MYFFYLFVLCSSLLFSKNSERETLLEIVAGEWMAHGVYVTAKLGIADHLLQGAKEIQTLAILTDSNEENLYRLLRFLSTKGIFQEGPRQTFSNTNLSLMLSSNHPQSLRNLLLFYGSEMSRSFSQLEGCIQKGIPAFELTFGKPVFEYFRDNPSSGKLFQAAMQEKSKAVIDSCLQMYDFGKFSTVYDIGGGTGLFLQSLLKKYPKMRGVLLELPSVTVEAKKKLEEFGERCGLIAGDFFKEIPPGADAYILKSILHDWDDESALKILKKCHDSMRKDSKLFLLEPIILKTQNVKDYAKCMDVLMMIITGGRERGESDFQYLLKESGFKIDALTPTDTEFVLIQASKL